MRSNRLKVLIIQIPGYRDRANPAWLGPFSLPVYAPIVLVSPNRHSEAEL
jgi:hypothetical protein